MSEGHPTGPFIAFSGRPRAYLEALATSWVKTSSAKAAGVVLETVWHWRRTVPGFAGAEDTAMQLGAEFLRARAVEIAAQGRVSYKFDKDGNALRHPDRCDCSHQRLVHVVVDGRNSGPCAAADCTCAAFVPSPYFEEVFEAKLLEKLLAAGIPKEFGDKTRGDMLEALRRVDVRRLPPSVMAELSAGVALEEVMMRMIGSGLAVPLLPPASGEIVVPLPGQVASGEGGADGQGGGEAKGAG